VFFLVLKKSNQCKAIRHGVLNFENGFVLVSHCICGKKAVNEDIHDQTACKPIASQRRKTMKDALLTQAQKLEPPGETAIREFADKWENMAATGTRLLMARPDLAKLVGRGNEKMAEDNNRNFPRFMLSLFSDYQPAVFVETVLWVFRAYRSHGFQTTYWAANLNIWVDLLQKELSEDAWQQIYPFYNWLIVNIPVFTAITDTDLPESVSNSPDHLYGTGTQK
jgi:hypothetical protein